MLLLDLPIPLRVSAKVQLTVNGMRATTFPGATNMHLLSTVLLKEPWGENSDVLAVITERAKYKKMKFWRGMRFRARRAINET